jgi:putative ABC transport system permease protein
MLKNYLKIALRNLLRQKSYSAINIAGLAIGISCFILILLFIFDEMSYDKFHSKANRIYRLIEKIDNEGQGEESSSCPLPVMQAVLTEYPIYVEEAVRVFNFQQPTFSLQIDDRKFNERKIFFVDSTFFKIFDYKFVEGDKEQALNGPNSIILTKQMADKYFGKGNALGKTLIWEGNFNLQVTGIIEEVPAQSHLHFDALISFSTIRVFTGPGFGTNWIWNPAWTYILLREGIKPENIEKEFPEFIEKYYPDNIKAQVTHYLQPLLDIHLKSKLDYEIEPNNDLTTVYIFGIVGILILLIACINFMNLATARSAKRSREVGMRKVLGAERKQLIWQFIGESILITFISVIVSLLLIELILPLFNSLAAKEIEFSLISNPLMILILLVVGLVVGIVSGTYPAFFLSSTVPIKTLKSKIDPRSKSIVLRKILVVMQFGISICLIIGTIIVYEQLSFLRSASLGFDQSEVLIIPTRPAMLQQIQAFKDELIRNKNISSVTVMNEILGEHHNTHEFNYEGMPPEEWTWFPGLIVDEDFVKTFDLKIISGRNFSKEFLRDDSLSVIINETMVQQLGWTAENAVGKKFNSLTGEERVIGVVKDFNYVSLQKPIGPYVLDLASFPFFKKFIAVKTAGFNIQSTIDYIEEKWMQIAPAFPFEFSFLDENLDKLYKAQDNLFKLIGYFSILAIFIACLGMFALASFTAEQRTKEIGIRKVLGASSSGIIVLLSKEFLKLVLISNLVAWPLSYFLMNRWLDDFAYKIGITFWSFIAATFAGLLIAFLTVSFQAFKASHTNPVNALKYE